jgi:ABC-2 type transport system permease protein
MTRVRWVVAGGVAALLAVVLVTVIQSIATWIGAAAGGSTAGDGLLGVASLGLYAAAIVGIGFAVGGLWRTSLAAEVAALVVVATFLLDLLVPPFNLPDWVHQLALTAHFGQPMIGRWDPVGIVLCVGIAVGGIALGALGVRRRDVER